MDDSTPTPAPAVVPAIQPTPAADANGQLIVAASIVVAATVIAVSLIIAMVITKNWGAMTIVGVIAGSLATALNAPTGVTSALRASKAADQ